jgi:hypothetical protein
MNILTKREGGRVHSHSTGHCAQNDLGIESPTEYPIRLRRIIFRRLATD